MNWLKRLLGVGTVVPDDRLKEVWPLTGDTEPPDWYSRGTVGPPGGFPCGGTNRRHSWKERGLPESSESCLRCGMARYNAAYERRKEYSR